MQVNHLATSPYAVARSSFHSQTQEPSQHIHNIFHLSEHINCLLLGVYMCMLLCLSRTSTKAHMFVGIVLLCVIIQLCIKQSHFILIQLLHPHLQCAVEYGHSCSVCPSTWVRLLADK